MNVAKFLCLTVLLAGSAHAKVYVCHVDGTDVYTASARSGACQEVKLQKIGSYSNSASSYATPAVPSSVRTTPQRTKNTASPANTAPSVRILPKGGGNQTRRAILEHELASERADLARLQGELNRIRDSGERSDKEGIARLESGIVERAQNIQALERELRRM